MREFEDEPVRGLPEALPPGEELLWQGTPRWGTLARRAFHVRTVAFYFGLLVVWRMGAEYAASQSVETALKVGAWFVALAAVVIGLIGLIAYLFSRTTVYTITSKRVVMRIGIAFMVALNLPFREIEAADLKRYPDGTGDIYLRLVGARRLSYYVLWPHVRPWRTAQTEPAFRAIDDVGQVAALLGKAHAGARDAADEVPLSAAVTDTPS